MEVCLTPFLGSLLLMRMILVYFEPSLSSMGLYLPEHLKEPSMASMYQFLKPFDESLNLGP